MNRRRIWQAALFALVLTSVGLVLYNYLPDANRQVDTSQTTPPPPPPNPVAFGIELDNLHLCEGNVQQADNLSEILNRNGVSFPEINQVVQASEGVFDVRKLRAGKHFCFLREDSLDKVCYFIYEPDPINYVVFDFNTSPKVYKGRRKVTEFRREASGIINSSLWKTLTDNDISPAIAVEMSKLFAWSIDFYRLHKGDQFKVIFAEKFVEGQKVGMGQIESAWFQHRGKDYYAVPFTDEEGKSDFYGYSGLSLKGAFLKTPLQFRRVSSKFNRRRYHPVLKRRRPHLGTDYAAATGTPVWAIGDGQVVKAKYGRGGGYHVEIRHNSTYTTRYLHFSKFAKGMKKGKRVSQGDVIGYVGSTGLATGPHLHFELIKDGKHVDSMQEEMPSGDPIQESCMESFFAYRDQVVEQLDGIKVVEVSAESADDAPNM